MDPKDHEIERLLNKPGEIDRLLGITEKDLLNWSKSRPKPEQKSLPKSPDAQSRKRPRVDFPDLAGLGLFLARHRQRGVILMVVFTAAVGSLLAYNHLRQGSRSQADQPIESVSPASNLISATILAKSDCWMEIRDLSAKTLYEGILKQGKSLSLTLPEGFEIYPGRPEMLELKVDGEAVKLGNALRWYRFPRERSSEQR